MPVLQSQSASQHQSLHKSLTQLWLNIRILSSTSMTGYGWGSSCTLAGSATNVFILKGWCACCLIVWTLCPYRALKSMGFCPEEQRDDSKMQSQVQENALKPPGRAANALKILLQPGNFLTSTFFLRGRTYQLSFLHHHRVRVCRSF